jgi:hypothetical protein
MKSNYISNIIICSLLFLTDFQAQTAEIAAKSHGSKNFSAETDNFGNQPMIPSWYIDSIADIMNYNSVDSIIYLNDSTFIQVTSDYGISPSRDTLINHPTFKEKSLEEIKSYYPTSTKFVGFEKSKKMKLNNTWILALILLLSGGIYVLKNKK